MYPAHPSQSVTYHHAPPGLPEHPSAAYPHHYGHHSGGQNPHPHPPTPLLPGSSSLAGSSSLGNPPSPGQPTSQGALREWFDAVDTDRSGYIDARKLQTALSGSGHVFSAGVAERLVRMFDSSGRGFVSFRDFEDLHHFLNAMVKGFRQRDTKADGRLDIAEVRAALVASGYHMSEPALQLMMRKFDTQKVGSLDLDDYIDLSILIGTATKVFSFYDQQRTGHVTFDFSNFFIAAVSMH